MLTSDLHLWVRWVAPQSTDNASTFPESLLWGRSINIRRAPPSDIPVSFQHLVEGLTQKLEYANYCFQSSALNVLQGAAETYLVSFFDDTNVCTILAKWVTIMPNNMQLAGHVHGKCLYSVEAPQSPKDNTNPLRGRGKRRRWRKISLRSKWLLLQIIMLKKIECPWHQWDNQSSWIPSSNISPF